MENLSDETNAFLLELCKKQRLTGIAHTPDARACCTQQLAGALAWSYGEFPNLIIVLILLHAWYLSDTKRSRIADERADKEGTPELDSYNAYLESLTRAADRNPTRKEPS